MKRFIAMLLCALTLFSFAGCAVQNAEDNYTQISGLDTNEKVSLKIAIVSETDKALDMVTHEFEKKYPNVNIQLEYIEDYDNTAISLFKSNDVDIIFQRGVSYSDFVESDSDTGKDVKLSTDDYYYNFAADEEIDFSHTTPKLMGNYTHTRVDSEGKEITYLYSVPMGGEVRGLFVNKTLLESIGKSVPANWDEFLDCCEVLKSAGYVPIQGNPASAATALMLASCVNGVVHDADSLEMMRRADSGVSLLFEDSFVKLYELAHSRYYDYKYIEELGQFKNVADVAQARSFLGLVRNEETYEYDTPENNFGTVAFFPYLSYLGVTIDKLIDDYHLDTDYTFIVTPTVDDSNSPTYLTPYYGICGNKNSKNLIWIREFVNFFFQTDMNKLYAENAGIIPNTADAIEYMANKYGVDMETACSSCGDIYFSDSYNGYIPLSTVIINTAKCGAQKYMVALNKDAQGNIQYYTDEDGKEYLLTEGNTKVYKEYIGEEDAAKPGYAFCTLEFFMEQLETEFAKYRGK